MTERKRLVADHFRRVWAIAQCIADEPGHSRRELSDRFHLSERQVQADLNLLRVDMRLPLVRNQGYRFLGEGPTAGAGAFDLRQAQLLVLVLSQARRDRDIPRERLDDMIAKLPQLFPAHLIPVVERTLEAVTAPRSGQQQVFAALADGLLRSAPVKLHYPPLDLSSPIPEPIVTPELLVPYLRSWYVIGECQQLGRTKMFNLDAVTAVTAAGAQP